MNEENDTAEQAGALTNICVTVYNEFYLQGSLVICLQQLLDTLPLGILTDRDKVLALRYLADAIESRRNENNEK